MTDIKPSVPPIIEAAEAVVKTVASPSLPVLIEDLVLVHKLVNEVKSQLAGKPHHLIDIFLVLFNLE